MPKKEKKAKSIKNSNEIRIQDRLVPSIDHHHQKRNKKKGQQREKKKGIK